MHVCCGKIRVLAYAQRDEHMSLGGICQVVAGCVHISTRMGGI